MPENDNVEPTTADSYTAADAIAELENENGSQDADNGTRQDETAEPSTEETDDEELDTDGGDDPSEEDDEEDDIPALDQTIRDALGDNAEAVKAWERQWKGVLKRERKLNEGLERLQADSKGFDAFQQYQNALSDPTTVRQTLQALVDGLKAHHGFDPLSKPDTESSSDDDFEYAIESDKVLAAKIKAEAKAELMQELGIDKSLLAEIKAEREAQAKQKELDSYVAGVTPRIAARAEKMLGWKVTKEMVATAVKEQPELVKTDPLLALKKTFPDEYANAIKPKSKAETPSMMESTTAKGMTIPTDPFEYSAAHALAELHAS